MIVWHIIYVYMPSIVVCSFKAILASLRMALATEVPAE